MNWIAILAAVLAIARALADWMHDKQLIDAGTNNAVVVGIKNAQDAIARAQKARELVRSTIARDPSSVLDDDGFKRTD